MSNHEAVAALPVTPGQSDAALIRAMCERRFAYALAASESATALVVVDPASGVVPLYLLQNATLFAYDSTDSTTTHDGVTCLVSSDGKRFKSGTISPPYSVLTKSTTAQPGSPAVGDRYLIPTAATGAAWSGKDGKIGIYTAAGWQFAVSPTGRFLYVEDETAFYHRNPAGTWTAGVGSITLGANSVTLANVIGAKASFVIKVENQTTNAPPASPAVGAAYIIGPSPTGAWAGLAGQLAICFVAGAFTIIAPVDGDQVYDKAKTINYTYSTSASAWVTTATGMIGSLIAGLRNSTTWTSGGSGTYTYSATTAPTTSLIYVEDSRTLTYTAKSAGNKLIFHYSMEALSGGVSGAWTVAIFRDSVANAIDWRYAYVLNGTIHGTWQFGFTAPDAASHVYKFRIISAGGTSVGTPNGCLFRVEEYAL